MEDRWKGKKVNLSRLSEQILYFFTKKNFTASLQKKKDTHIVVATPQPFHGIAENIEVYIEGRPDDFSIKFAAGSHSRAYVRYGSLLNLVGFGFFVMKGLRSLEEIEKLEKNFWIYVDETIWQLSDSA